MKIKKIKFCNINSLKGEWEIDFEKFDNLFLISGNTGSGKTTILDAICLALYAKTPRQDNGEALMSKNTGECYSECEFEVKGDIYKSYWGLRRARNKPYGKVQPPKMKLIKNEEVILEKVTETKNKIEEITNFDFAKFTKSMLLAQGGFDKFLKAKDSEKATLLEEITGSKIYGAISTKVYEVYNQKLNEIKELKLKIDDSEILSNEDIEKLKQEIKLLKEEFDKLDEEFKDKQLLKNNYEKFNNLTNDLSNANEKLKEINIKIEAIKPLDTEILKQEEIVKLKFNTLNNNQKEIKTLENEITKNQNELKILSTNDIEKEIKKLKNQIKELETEYNELNFQNIEELLIQKSKIEKSLLDTKQYKKLKKEKEDITKTLKTLNIDSLVKNKDNLLKEIEELEEIINATLKIIDFEKERKNLVDGEPCPLCGSTNHPYTKGLPEYSKNNKEELKQKKELFKNIEDEILKINNQKNRYEIELKNIDEKLNTLQPQDEVKLTNELEKLELEIKEKLTINQQKETLQTKIKKLNTTLSNKEKELLQVENKITELKTDISNQTKLLDKLNKENEEINKFFDSLKIDNIDNFLAKIENIKSKQIELKNLENEKIKITTKIENIQNELNKIDKKEDINQEELNELQTKLKESQTEITKQEHLIELNNKKSKKLEDTINLKEAKEKELKYYELLNNLIGQKDGGKYRTFVQNLTLKHLINLANNHLKTLTDRYLLTKTSQDNLNLEIIDLYQANTIRDISTLSGGESFLVSLALSLGLTDLVSDKIKIDTLFIDEGFGSLDENSLNIVIDSLERLQSTGKIIGVISHIWLLKERIISQIQLFKKSDGFSEIKVKG